MPVPISTSQVMEMPSMPTTGSRTATARNQPHGVSARRTMLDIFCVDGGVVVLGRYETVARVLVDLFYVDCLFLLRQGATPLSRRVLTAVPRIPLPAHASRTGFGLRIRPRYVVRGLVSRSVSIP